VRLGPLWMNPTISFPNVGIDTNVFNDPPNIVPSKDFTVTAVPETELWLRLGRTWLSGTVREEINWYQKYTTERSANSTYILGWKAPLNRLLLGTTATWVNTRERPGFEIDARAKRKEPSYEGTVEVRGFAKTFIGVGGSWRRVAFDEAAIFKGNSLQEQLDRTETSASLSVRHALTPLTSIAFSAGRSKQQYRVATSRNATSDDYKVSLSFDPAALLKGSASFGYSSYQPESADLPHYNGTTADVELAYTLLDSTRMSIEVVRSVEFSYDVEQPYFILTGGNFSIAQQVFGPIDVVARLGTQRLAYQTRVGANVEAPDRTDRVKTYGGGVGYRLGQSLRLGFNVDKERRTSVVADREYRGLKYGTSITYGD
jgi:hypothetical protein